jgi:hypothetical protein
LLWKSEGRNVRCQHPQMHIGNYESLKAHWIMKVSSHIALKVWRKERSLTTPLEAHCELRKSECTLNYESLKTHCSESLKEETFVDNTFRGTLRITKVWMHIKLRKSEGPLLWKSEGRNVRWQHLQTHIVNYESLKTHCSNSLKERTFVDNTFRDILRIMKVWMHIKLRKCEGTFFWKSERRDVRWQQLQRHTANYESLNAHWITKVWRHIALKVWRKECSSTTPSEAHCELWKSKGTLNYESLKAHCSESLKEGMFIDNTFRRTLWIMKVWRHIALIVWRKEHSLTTPSEAHCELWKSEGTLNYKSVKTHCPENLNQGMFITNTFRGTLRIMKVWRHIELWKSEGTLLWKSERRNARWQHLKRHIELWKSEGTLLW